MLSINFRTREFPCDAEGDLVYCNGQPGSAVAKWLQSELTNAGIRSREPLQEDYGWGFWLDSPAAVWVAVSLVADEPGQTDAVPEWCVSVSHEISLFAPRQWFRRQAGRELASRAFEIIEAAIQGRPEFAIEESEGTELA